MAIKRPLVLIDGKIKELPLGDSLDGSSSGSLFAIPVSVVDSNGEPKCVFSKDGITVVPRQEGAV